MMLASLVLSAALVPQQGPVDLARPADPPLATVVPAAVAQEPAAEPQPPPQEPAGQSPEAAMQEPPAAAPMDAAQPAAPRGSAEPAIAAGLAAFRSRRFSAARAAFEEAVAQDPQSAAAAFYLGYTHYKMGEPSRRMNENKERAKELFAKAFSLDPTFRPTFR